MSDAEILQKPLFLYFCWQIVSAYLDMVNIRLDMENIRIERKDINFIVFKRTYRVRTGGKIWRSGTAVWKVVHQLQEDLIYDRGSNETRVSSCFCTRPDTSTADLEENFAIRWAGCKSDLPERLIPPITRQLALQKMARQAMEPVVSELQTAGADERSGVDISGRLWNFYVLVIKDEILAGVGSMLTCYGTCVQQAIKNSQI